MATRALGTLTLDLIAKTGSFEQGLDRASRKAQRSAKDIDKAAVALDRFVLAAGAAGVAFVAAAAKIAMSSAQTMDDMAKLSQAVGVSVEALSALTYAAGMNAVEQQTLANAISRLTKGMDDATRGTGEAKKAFDSLGISVTDSTGKLRNADDVLLDFADEMSKLRDGSEKTALAIQAFGRSGAQMIPFLNNGRDGIKQLTDEAERFGVVMDTKVAQQAERFNDNMMRLSTIQKGLAYELTSVLLPAMELITDKLVAFASDTENVGKKIETALKVAGVAAAATAAIFVSKLVASVTASAVSFAAATIEAAKYQAALARMAGVSAAAAAGVASLTAAARAASLVMGVLGGPVGLIATLALSAAAFVTFGSSAKNAALDADAFTKSLEKATEKQLKLIKLQLSQSIEEAGIAMIEAQKNVDALSARLEHAENSFFRNATAVKQLRDKLTEAEAGLDTASQKMTALIRRNDELASAFKTTRAEAIAAANGIAVLGGALDQTNEAGAKFLERLENRALLAGVTTVTGELNKMIEAGKLVFSPEDEKRAREWAKTIDASAKATTRSIKPTKDLTKAVDDFEKERQAAFKAQREYLSGLEKENRALEDQIAVFGLGKGALERLTIARLEEKKAVFARIEGFEEYVGYLQREIDLLNERAGLAGRLAELEENKRFNEEVAANWEKTVGTYADVFRTGFADMLNNGKKGWKSFTQSLKTTFKTTVADALYKMFAQPFVVKIAASLAGITGAGGTGSAIAGALGGGGQGGGLISSLTGAVDNISSLGSVVKSAWGALTGSGLTAVGSTAAGAVPGVNMLHAGGAALLGGAAGMTMVGSATAAGAAIPGMGMLHAGGAAAFGGGAGLMGAISAAAPWVAGAFALASAFGLFDHEPTTRRGKSTVYAMEGDGVTRITDEISQDAAYYRSIEQMTTAAIDGLGGMFEALGIDARLEHLWARTDIATNEGGHGVSSGGSIILNGQRIDIGIPHSSDDTKFGFGGWSEEDPLSRLGVDLQMTILEAMQAVAGELPSTLAKMLEDVNIRGLSGESVQALSGAFDEIITGVEMFTSIADKLPFKNLIGLSFDATANLIAFSGGLDQLDKNLTFYYQNFHTEAERMSDLTGQLSKAFSELNQTLPSSRDEFRSMVEAIDLSDEAGQVLYATMMSLAPAFDAVASHAKNAHAAMDQISSGIAGIRETVLLDQLRTDSAKYDYFKQQADGLARLIPQLTDLDAIQAAMAQATSATGSAYGMLDENQRLQMGGEFLDYLDRVEDIAHKQIEQVNNQQAEANAKIMADAVAGEMQKIGDAIVRSVNSSSDDNRVTAEILRSIGNQLAYSGSQIAPYEEVNT